MLSLLVTLTLASQPSQAELKTLALAHARKIGDAILKAPSTARYQVVDVVKLPPDAVRVQGRYRVEVSVDAQNSFGVPLRSRINAVYRVADTGAELLRSAYVETDGTTHDVFEASADKSTRPEVAKYIRDDWKRRQETLKKITEGKTVGIVPRDKPKRGKKMSKREIDEETRITIRAALTHYKTKFGLEYRESAEILGIKMD